MTSQTPHNPSWRRGSQENIVYAKMVILIFLAVCFSVGFIADVLINLFWYKLTPMESVVQIIMLKKLPVSIFACSILGIIYVVVTYVLQREIMLSGLDVKHLTKLTDLDEKQNALLQILESMSKSIGLSQAPDIYIANTPVLNAFVSGSRESYSFMVLTQGLIEHLTINEVQAVMAVQLCRIKLSEQRLALAVALVSHIGLVIFDSIVHDSLYGKKQIEEPGPIKSILINALKIIRFLSPVGTFLFRFILTPHRIFFAENLTVQLMKENESLAKALIKIHDYQFDNIDEIGLAYQHIACDEIRRESYLMDPADLNRVKTFATPFTTHPSLEEQLEAIGYIKEKEEKNDVNDK